jgi:hypothetical protein
MIHDMTAAELADELTKRHEQVFKDDPKAELMQTVLVQTEDGRVLAIPCGWENAMDRQFKLTLLRELMVVEKVIRYAIWAEVWMKMETAPPEVQGQKATKDTLKKAVKEFSKRYEHGDLSRDPNRIECIFTLVVETGGKLTSRVQTIERGRNGGVRRLVRMEEKDDTLNMGGALAELMPERTIQ